MSLPDGMIPGNGQPLSRQEYAGLYEAVAQAYGPRQGAGTGPKSDDRPGGHYLPSGSGDLDPFLTFSASLPLRRVDDTVVIHWAVRPWNGRELTVIEAIRAYEAADAELRVTGSFGLAAQAAHEWLSEHAP